jgi:C4-dicarboxylate-specific signal transduction histidine kinase
MITVVYSNLGYIGVVLERINNERKATLQRNNQLTKSLQKREAIIKSFVRLKAFSALGWQGTAVVHEIMQPLTAMRFGLENLTRYFEKQGAPSEVFERINAAKEPAERSIRIVENLRNLMVENNIEIKAVNLHEKISDCLIVLRDRVNALQINVNIDSMSKEILVLADNNQIQHVLLNILSNAIDAMERNPSDAKERKVVVQITYIDKKRYVSVDIIDTGPGIPEKIRDNLFEWLSTGTKSGMGVGLALSKHFIESWGGSISADNANAAQTGLTGAVIHLKLRAA